MRKRMLSLFLCLVMILGHVPIVALAEEEERTECDGCGHYHGGEGACSCGFCSIDCSNASCWAESHCNECGECLMDKDYWCEETLVCEDCLENNHLHCSECKECFCAEDGEGLCKNCYKCDMCAMVCESCGFCEDCINLLTRLRIFVIRSGKTRALFMK